MLNVLRKAFTGLTSLGYAVAAISLLLGASVAGWIFTEIVPHDYAARREFYAEQWGAGGVRVIEALGLYDPFHSIWFRCVVAFFFVVLLLCLCARSGRFAARSARIEPPAGLGDLTGTEPCLDVGWKEIALHDGIRDPLIVLEKRYGKKREADRRLRSLLFARVRETLLRKGYRVVSAENDDGIFFAAVTGRWRFAANLLLHAGIVVIAVGGMATAFWGSTDVITGRPGDTVRIGASPYSLLIEDFQIVMTGRMRIKDYVTRISILDSRGEALTRGEVEVNRPFAFNGYRIYQSSYHLDSEEFRRAHIEVIDKETLRQAFVTIGGGDEARIEGTDLSIRPGRYSPDIAIVSRGTFHPGARLTDTALEVEVTSGLTSERGWLYLHNPHLNSEFAIPVHLNLIEIEPVFHTRLGVSTNPGAPALLAGMGAAAIGLCLLSLMRYRLIRGGVGRDRFIIAGAAYEWAVSFNEEFEGLKTALISAMRGVLTVDA